MPGHSGVEVKRCLALFFMHGHMCICAREWRTGLVIIHMNRFSVHVCKGNIHHKHDLGLSLSSIFRNSDLLYLFFFFDNSTQKMSSGSSKCLICAQLFLIPSTDLSYLKHSSLLSQTQLFLIPSTAFSCLRLSSFLSQTQLFLIQNTAPVYLIQSI